MEAKGFDAFYREAFGDVFRTAYLIVGERQEALDLTQEAFVRAFERWTTVRSMSNPDAWVQRVVSNLAISWHRKRARRTETTGPSTALSYAEVSGTDPDLVEALRELSPAQRVVIVLRFYLDQSVEQVASTLGKRPGTVRALTAQGVARLRELVALDQGDRP